MNSNLRNLTDEERNALLASGCTATDFKNVQVADGFDPTAVRNVHFDGRVSIGRNVRIANVGVHIANYDIADNVCIENIGTLATNPGASFGNGTEVEVLNEGGGREVILFNELSAQFAHLMCLHRHQPELIDKLNDIANQYAATQRSDRGSVGAGTTIRSVKEIIDVNIGESASINGASTLVNGTILSSAAAATVVGTDVQAEDFIFAEGASVTGASMVSKCYVGQGTRLGRQFSAEHSLFFANCEGFHGEAVCIFAGPYTVTHHKSTLLIAGLYSFYNAGSGTNQSNHMYKLGPVHEGKLERGCKTGSFSYMMWPCRVGSFSVVLGKHKGTFDTSDFPFAFIEATAAGKCTMVPGLNLTTVGTVRDGAKWPTRDRRTAAVKRDRISFDVFSPYTIGRMIKGSAILKTLQDETDRSVDEVFINGARVKRVLLRTGQKFYRTGIELYLLDKVIERAESAIADGTTLVADLASAFAPTDGTTNGDDRIDNWIDSWIDISGQLMPRQRLDDLTSRVMNGAIADVDAFDAELDSIAGHYADDEWAFVRRAYERVFERSLDGISTEALAAVADSLLKVKSRFLKQVLGDAQKEFDDATRTGFGYDGAAESGADDADRDFASVRGAYEDNTFVKQMQQELASLEDRIATFKSNLSANTQIESSLP